MHRNARLMNAYIECRMPTTTLVTIGKYSKTMFEGARSPKKQQHLKSFAIIKCYYVFVGFGLVYPLSFECLMVWLF